MLNPLPGLCNKLDLFNPELPLSKAETIPSLWYFDEEMYRTELAHVFGATWQVAGKLTDLPESGSYFTTTIGEEPVVVLRDERGNLRAFYNICRHRAAAVVGESCEKGEKGGKGGKVTRLRCRYHGWTYDLQGNLRGVPEFERVENFRREDNGLIPLQVAAWGPYIWVHGGKNPPSLMEYLAPLPEKVLPFNLETLQCVGRKEYIMECNWKIFIDNFQDGGYHINYVHPDLASAVEYSGYHTEMAEHVTVQVSPLKSTSVEDVNRLRTGDAALYWWVFPNFIVNLYSGVMDTNLVVPLGPNRCKVIYDFFYPPPATEKDRLSTLESIELSEKIQLEDGGICEEVQRGIRSRAFKTGRYSVKREEPVYHFHKLLAHYLKAGQVGDQS